MCWGGFLGPFDPFSRVEPAPLSARGRRMSRTTNNQVRCSGRCGRKVSASSLSGLCAACASRHRTADMPRCRRADCKSPGYVLYGGYCSSLHMPTGAVE
jgi:hypothetical protein